jgi:hypothetical protein
MSHAIGNQNLHAAVSFGTSRESALHI